MESGLSHQYVNLASIGSVHFVKAGQGPPLVLLHGQDAAERYPSIEVRIFQDCGQWPQMEHSEAFNQDALAFLDRVYNTEREPALSDS